MIKKLGIAICLAALSPSAASAQVFSNGKNICDAKNKYVGFSHNVLTYSDGTTEEYYSANITENNPPMAYVGDLELAEKLKALEAHLIKVVKSAQLRDSGGKAFTFLNEVGLFNLLAGCECGYEYVKNDPTDESTMTTQGVKWVATRYVFKKK